MITAVFLAMLVMPVVADDKTLDITNPSGTTTVTESQDQKYIVTIPDSVQFNGEAIISASEVVLNDGAKLEVTVSSGDDGWNLVHKNGVDKHPYNMYIKGEETPVENGAIVLTVSVDSASVTLTFAKEGYLKKAGTWTDTLTFTISQEQKVTDATGFNEALKSGADIVLSQDTQISAGDTTANSGYGATGVRVINGATFDGNGKTLTVTNAWNTWDCAVNPTSGTIKNLVIDSAMRGIFMSGATGDVYVDNVVINGPVYAFNSDAGNKNYGVYISDSTLNGWTSFSDVHKEVIFTNCNFGKGAGYAFCRPYNACEFIDCNFEEGFKFDTSQASEIVFKNCYYGTTLITVDNAATLGVGDGEGRVTLFFNGVGSATFE